MVRLLQSIKGRPDVRRRLGYADTTSFTQFIDSLLPLASRLERLAPSIARFREPNPEYPWQGGDAVIRAPHDYAFDDFSPINPQS